MIFAMSSVTSKRRFSEYNKQLQRGEEFSPVKSRKTYFNPDKRRDRRVRKENLNSIKGNIRSDFLALEKIHVSLMLILKMRCY